MIVQSLSQAPRQYVHDIMLLVCEQHPKIVTGMGKRWMAAMIEAVDGEKDPRNLMIVFKVVCCSAVLVW